MSQTHRRTASGLSCGYADARECKKWILITPEIFNYRTATRHKSVSSGRVPEMTEAPRRGLRTQARAIFTHPSGQQTYLLITRSLPTFPIFFLIDLKGPDTWSLICDWSASLTAITWHEFTVLSAAARNGGRVEFVLINMGFVLGGRGWSQMRLYCQIHSAVYTATHPLVP